AGAEARRLAAERRADALQAALETRHSGQSAGWEAAAADEAGTVTPTRTFRNSQGRYCREYREEIRVGGRSETVMGIACRLPEGGWAPRYRVIPGADNI
ncbi:MAG: hypothetical protein KDE22_10195, partial [Rhodobacterales bacterium]|nr:hypothetical protein [Rhodobacterales bacterium]